MVAENSPADSDRPIADDPSIIDQAAVDPGHHLVSSRRVEGTRVYNRQGEKLGTIHSVMIDKVTGQTAFAVMAFGGFLGLGELVHPIPWQMLTYDVERDGYVVDLTREQLEKAPTLSLDQADRPSERSYADLVYTHYYPF